MKILFLITKSDIGGAQKYVHDLAAHLPKNEFQAEIVTGGRGGVRFLSNSFRPYFLFLNDIAAVIEIAFLLRKKKPDILHLNSSKAGVVGAIAAKLYNAIFHYSLFTIHSVKVVFTAHGWVFNPALFEDSSARNTILKRCGANPENRYSWLRQHLYILFHKFAALFQDAIINVSEYDRQLALRYNIAPAKKLFTIHNGIDVTKIKFLDRDSARRALLQSAKLTTNNLQLTTWVGSVGRLVAEKNYATLIDAIAPLKSQLSIVNCLLFIIGDGYERAALEKKIAALGLQGNVFLIPTIPDMAQYLRAFDVFVMSSIKEGLPYTLVEAMAAGLPIVATKTGGMPEILEPDKGIVVSPRDPAALAEAIQKLLTDPALQKTLAANARACAERELTLQRMMEQTIKTYESLAIS